MIPARAPSGVRFAPRFEPIVTAKDAGFNTDSGNADKMGTYAIVIGILFKIFAVMADVMPYKKIIMPALLSPTR